MLRRLLGGKADAASIERQVDRLQASLPYTRHRLDSKVLGSIGLASPPSSSKGSLVDFLSKFSLVKKKALSVEAMARLYPPKPAFIPLSQSPHPDIRRYASDIVAYSSCPVCLEQKDILPSENWNNIESIPGGTSRREPAPKSRCRPEFVCPDCGFPTHCDRDHWEADRESHAAVCGVLKQWVLDENDIKSGRKFWEMTFPGRQNAESVLNFTSWPFLLTTRRFPKAVLQNAITQRHISRYLTYPYTLAAMLYNPWIYHDAKDDKSGSVVTDTGMHILSGLSHAIEVSVRAAHREHLKMTNKRLKQVTFTTEATAPNVTNDPFRIFILGPRVESRLPAFVWEQLSLTFPGVPFRLYFIGPESAPPSTPISTTSATMGRQAPGGILPMTRIHERPVTSQTLHDNVTTIHSLIHPVSVNLRMEYIAAPYETVHDTFGPFNRRRDIFVLFNSGIGHYVTRESWRPALTKILKTKCLTVVTSLNEQDQKSDFEALKEDHGHDFTVAVRPTWNKFASMRPDIPVDCVHDADQWVYCNWGVFAVHGVGSDVDNRRDEDFTVEEKKEKPWWSW